MGRLIDESKVFEVMKHHWLSGSIAHHIIDDIRTDIIKNVPTVDAIPKDQYKADMIAMLTDIKKEIDDIPINPIVSDKFKLGQATAYDKCEFLIQQKIDKLKEDGK